METKTLNTIIHLAMNKSKNERLAREKTHLRHVPTPAVLAAQTKLKKALDRLSDDTFFELYLYSTLGRDNHHPDRAQETFDHLKKKAAVNFDRREKTLILLNRPYLDEDLEKAKQLIKRNAH